MNGDAPCILTVGHCAADHAAIARVLEEAFGAVVEAAGSAAEAWDELARGRVDLVAVNRVFEFGGDGLEFLRQLKSDPRFASVPAMLVSNFEWAQKQAVERGALPGFGKDALGSPAMIDAVRRALEGPA